MGAASIPALALILFVIVQRLAELWLARRNTGRLRARGGREIGAGHYPLIVALHAGWILSLLAFGWQAPVSLPWLAAYAVLQGFRVWILASLGNRWTTRIIVIDEPLVRRGPYRFLAHPNYVLVAAELAVVPLALGLPLLALVFTGLNLLVLSLRIRVENRALAPLSRLSDTTPRGIEPGAGLRRPGTRRSPTRPHHRAVQTRRNPFDPAGGASNTRPPGAV